MGEGVRKRKKEVDPEDKLAVGDLRFSTALGVLFRVLAIETGTCTIELVPGHRRWRSDAPSTLEKAGRVAEGGLRWRLVHQGSEAVLDARPSELVQWLLLDERARRWERLRVRSIRESLEGLPGGPETIDRVLDFLEMDAHWIKEGASAEQGFVRVDEVPDWRQRWRTAELPMGFGGKEAETEDAARAVLERLCSAPAPDLPLLGRVRTTRWLPASLRQRSLERLLEAWGTSRTRSAFRLVREEALTDMLDAQLPVARAMASEPAVSVSVREAALARLGGTDEAFLAALNDVPARGGVRVASQLAALSDSREVVIACVAAIFTRPPEPEAWEETRDLLEERLSGLDRSAVLAEAAARALVSRGKARRILEWLDLLDPDGVARSLVSALGTAQRLSGGGSLEAFSITTTELLAGIERWTNREMDQSGEPPPNDVEPPGGRPNWADLLKADAERARRSWHLGWLQRAVEALADLAAGLDTDLSSERRRAEDTENAERVLRGLDTRRIHADRDALLSSVRDQVTRERQAERKTIAIILAEACTAVGRTREAAPHPSLDALERRLSELATRLDLSFVGRVGDVVPLDLAIHQARGGVVGEGVVRSVGIRDSTETLVKATIARVEGR